VGFDTGRIGPWISYANTIKQQHTRPSNEKEIRNTKAVYVRHAELGLAHYLLSTGGKWRFRCISSKPYSYNCSFIRIPLHTIQQKCHIEQRVSIPLLNYLPTMGSWPWRECHQTKLQTLVIQWVSWVLCIETQLRPYPPPMCLAYPVSILTWAHTKYRQQWGNLDWQVELVLDVSVQ
jgi:hypothetical protein